MPDDLSYDAIVTRLRAAGCVYAEDEAAHLLAAADAADDLAALVARRVAGEPLEWVVGWAFFGTEDGEGIRVAVTPGVFVPRGRTIELALAALERLSPGDTLVELCCGSGAISAYLVDRVDDLDVWAADIDPDAVASAQHNLPGARVVVGDLFEPLPPALRGTVAVLVANTPYVPSDQVALMPAEARDHEPLHTLDGGPDGLALLRRIASEASTWLRPGGSVLIEIAESQFDAARVAFEAAGLVTSGLIDPDGTTVIVGLRS
ncbi:putative protein N(5)-glutamine methyltransferase [Marmoricola sp. OAE513]|uniref:putative protein N(5)-glutamine methyltransferase n=1 Tax=Marmoricola sp. OAE513 TaxID=2817894 RepID=UPI001D645385